MRTTDFLLRGIDTSIVRKNHLARCNKQNANGAFTKAVAAVFDEVFLKAFVQAQPLPAGPEYDSAAVFLRVRKDQRMNAFIASLKTCYHGEGKIDDQVA